MKQAHDHFVRLNKRFHFKAIPCTKINKTYVSGGIRGQENIMAGQPDTAPILFFKMRLFYRAFGDNLKKNLMPLTFNHILCLKTWARKLPIDMPRIKKLSGLIFFTFGHLMGLWKTCPLCADYHPALLSPLYDGGHYG